MGVGQEHGTHLGMTPQLQLFPQRSGGFNQVTASLFVGDAQGHWKTAVVLTKASTTRPDAPRLGAATVLRRAQDRHRDHALG